MTGLTIGSVCSGIGGLEMGLEQAGHGPTIYQVEIDPYARGVLARHWPQARRFEDLIALAEDPSEVPYVDILCGGTPCQDMSAAGKRLGIHGPRSSLWFSMLSLVQKRRPRYVVWENVPGSVRRGMEHVVAGLTAAGYAVVGSRIRASDLGAHHRRERVFLVGALAHPDPLELRHEQGRGDGPCRPRASVVADDGHAGSLAHPDGERGEEPFGDLDAFGRWIGNGGQAIARGDVADPGSGGRDAWGRPIEGEHRTGDGGRLARVDAWPAEPDVGRVAHGVPHRAHRLAGLGNAVVPACSAIAGHLIADHFAGRLGW